MAWCAVGPVDSGVAEVPLGDFLREILRRRAGDLAVSTVCVGEFGVCTEA